MAEYKIYFKRSAVKDLAAIFKKDLQRIINRIDLLKEDPRPPGCEKLSSQERYRVRQGNYRIVYSIQDDVLTIWVVKIGRRRDVYR
ncbi:MAG: type II toxin-antitoxin system RelE/ParE family toxin [Desulfobacterales bacterium]